MNRIMVVDDDLDLASIIEEKVKALGECKVCSSGHQAIEELQSQRYSVVVTDYIMQGGDGASLAHYCTNHSIPVLVVSSFPESQIRPYLPEGATFINKFHAVRGNTLEETLRNMVSKLRSR